MGKIIKAIIQALKMLPFCRGSRYTQYVPIRFVLTGTGNKFYLLQCRKNKRTGKLCFINTRVHPLWALVCSVPDISFNAQENMDKIIAEK